MFKRFLFAIVTLFLTMGLAFAQVDVNKASQAELDGVKGIGPKISKSIVDERTKGGNFKDWADLETRVKGIGEKNSAKMSQAGLTVNGQSKSGAPAKEVKKADKAAAKQDKKAEKSAAKDEKGAEKAAAKDDKAASKPAKKKKAAAKDDKKSDKAAAKDEKGAEKAAAKDDKAASKPAKKKKTKKEASAPAASAASAAKP